MLFRSIFYASLAFICECLIIGPLMYAYDNAYFADIRFSNSRPFAGVSSLNVVLILLSLSWYDHPLRPQSNHTANLVPF